jgi:hypothetical protein
MKGVPMSTIEKKDVARKVVQLVVGSTTAFAVGHVLANNIAPNLKKSQKVQILIGTMIVANMVSDKAEVWADEKLQKLFPNTFKKKPSETPES